MPLRIDWLLPLVALAIAGVSRGESPPLEPTPLAVVRGLSREELAANPPVRVRAVVTRARRSSLFIQDDSAGLYVNVARARLRGVMSADVPIP